MSYVLSHWASAYESCDVHGERGDLMPINPDAVEYQGPAP